MRFQLPYLLSSMLLVAGTAQACVEYQATISYANGYMAGTAVDNGLQTCTLYSVGTGANPNVWYWNCISGYYLKVYNDGIRADYCTPAMCSSFDISCNYAPDIIGCGAAAFGC